MNQETHSTDLNSILLPQTHHLFRTTHDIIQKHGSMGRETRHLKLMFILLQVDSCNYNT